MKSQDERVSRLLYNLQKYVLFFLMVAFSVTCCMLLFISRLQQVMGLVFTAENIQSAAKLTFGNVILLTTLFVGIDSLRRRYMVQRPVRLIVQTAEKLMQGDFSARIPPLHGTSREDGLGDIARCFNQLAEELSHTETLRSDFIANVSHELKTPLAVMQNYAVMLQTPGLDTEKRQEYAAAIADAARRLASLITNILRLNRLENQQIFPTRRRFDLGEQLCECLLAFEDAWEKKGLDIQTDLEDGVMVENDAELLTLVWNNLFSNAIKFTQQGCVSLKLHAEGPHAVVTVSDTGCGFGKAVGQHIFEKFYQGDSSRATQGNGLGLALVRRVVDIVGGEISVESEVGKGTAFTVRIRRQMHEVA